MHQKVKIRTAHPGQKSCAVLGGVARRGRGGQAQASSSREPQAITRVFGAQNNG